MIVTTVYAALISRTSAEESRKSTNNDKLSAMQWLSIDRKGAIAPVSETRRSIIGFLAILFLSNRLDNYIISHTHLIQLRHNSINQIVYSHWFSHKATYG